MSTRKDAPPRPTGTGLAAQFFQWVWDNLAAGRFPLIDTPTVKWDRNSGGYAANVVAKGVGVSGAQSTGGFAGDDDITKAYPNGAIVRITVSGIISGSNPAGYYNIWATYGAIQNVPVPIVDGQHDNQVPAGRVRIQLGIYI